MIPMQSPYSSGQALGPGLSAGYGQGCGRGQPSEVFRGLLWEVQGTQSFQKVLNPELPKSPQVTGML